MSIKRHAIAGFCFNLLFLVSLSAESPGTPRPLLDPTAKSIERFVSRVEENPKDTDNLLMLGRLYFRQAKEEDAFDDFLRAETCFRNAMNVDPESLPAKVFLAQACMAQHRFQEALDLASQVAAADPKASMAWSVVFDANLELGDYDKANDALNRLDTFPVSAAQLARKARWEELHGKTTHAISLIERATKMQIEIAGLPSELSWFQWRHGILLLNAGKLDAAAVALNDALKTDPTHAQAHVGLARVRVAEGKPDEAIGHFKAAIELRAEPPTIAELGDLLEKTGDRDGAISRFDEAQRLIEEEAKQVESGAAHRREAAMFFCDHDRRMDFALELAKQEMSVRHDIYSYDTLAWAHFKNGQLVEAQEAIAKAIKLGTRDSSLYYHAGTISNVVGDHDLARKHFEQCLAMNPYFSLPESATLPP